MKNVGLLTGLVILELVFTHFVISNHGFTILGKCVFVYIKNCEAIVTWDMLHRILWNFIFSCTLTRFTVFKLWVKLKVPKKALLSCVLQKFSDTHFSASTVWINSKFYIQSYCNKTWDCYDYLDTAHKRELLCCL